MEIRYDWYLCNTNISYRITEKTRIGSQYPCEMVVFAQSIAPYHAKLETRKDHVLITKKMSSDVRINNEQINQQHISYNYDVITFGTESFTLIKKIIKLKGIQVNEITSSDPYDFVNTPGHSPGQSPYHFNSHQYIPQFEEILVQVHVEPSADNSDSD